MVITMVTFSSYADQNIMVGAFSQSDLSGWEEKSFKGNSVYELTGSGNQTFLRASTDGMASGMFREVAIDLTKTPWINWSWRVENTFRNNNERTKEGDDYAARVYVVVSGGLFFWKTRAVNYVWSSHEPAGSIWSNAYTENARMVAVRSGDQQVGQWQTERRNVREDLKALFEEDITRIDAVAVMIDGDNTGQSAVSYFGDIFFSTH
ncbi:DUF3047 domain-containing protein [Kaarinaea lacus]